MTAVDPSPRPAPFGPRTVERGLSSLGSGLHALDLEVARLDAHLRSLSPEEWVAPTRCTEWSVRDVVAHLASGELYNEACNDDRLDTLGEWADDEEYNVVHVRSRRALPVQEVYAEWRARQRRVRAAWGRLDAGERIKTQIGPYPVGLQAWHIASEYATHSDDIGVPVPPAQRAERRAWRYAFSRYAVEERALPHAVTPRGDAVLVTHGGTSVLLTVDELVEAVSARLDLSRFPPEGRAWRVALRSLV